MLPQVRGGHLIDIHGPGLEFHREVSEEIAFEFLKKLLEDKGKTYEVKVPIDLGAKQVRNKRSKVSEADKISVEEDLKGGLSAPEIAKKYGVSTGYVYIIKARLKRDGDL